jgi:hypothetical protein
MTISLSQLSASAAVSHSLQAVFRRANEYCERQVELTINDMKFTGKLRNSVLTPEAIVDIVWQAMADMGLNENDLVELDRRIDKMLDNTKLSDADKKNLLTAIMDMAGAAIPSTSIAASLTAKAASLLSALISMLNNDDTGYALGVGGTLPGKVSTGVSWGGAGWRILNEWKKDQQKWKEMADGLDAIRILQHLFRRIDRLIEDFVNNNIDKNVLEFKGAKDGPRYFTLYNAPCDEKWELVMTLNYKGKSTSTPNVNGGHFAGRYEGDFDIYIEYDIGMLPFHLGDMADVGQRFTQHVEPALGPFNIDVIEGSKAKRTISGMAEAFVRVNDIGKIDFNKKEDWKRATVVADFFSERHYLDATYTSSFIIEFSLEDEIISLTQYDTTATLTAPDFYKTATRGTVMGSVPIEGYIYSRGDNLSPAILKALPNH